jgi:hypothetical protein
MTENNKYKFMAVVLGFSHPLPGLSNHFISGRGRFRKRTPELRELRNTGAGIISDVLNLNYT